MTVPPAVVAESLAHEKRSVACRTGEDRTRSSAETGAIYELSCPCSRPWQPPMPMSSVTPRPKTAPRGPAPSFIPPSFPPSAGSGPTSWRRQHGHIETPNIDGREFRPFWRAHSQLDKLLARDLITSIQWQAANTFRLIYEKAHQGELGAKDLSEGVYIDRNCRRRGTGEPDQKRLVALMRLKRVQRELGDVGYRILTWLAVEDFSWAEIGRRLKVDPKTARRWGLLALRACPAP